MKSLILKLSLLSIPLLVLFIGCVDSLTSTDKLPPYVAVYSPKTNDTIAYGRTAISYSARDDQELSYLELYINNTLIKRYNVESGVLPKVYLETDSTLINTTINYYVKAYDVAGNSSVSNTMTGIVITEDRTAPKKPYNLYTVVISSTSVKLVWDDSSTNETSFTIMKKESGGSYYKLATVGKNITSYDDTGLDSNKTYYYYVYASNKYGISESSNEVNSRGTGPLNAPTNLSGTPLSMNQIKLVWRDNSTEEQKFVIIRKGIADSYYNEIASVGANTTEYIDKSVWGGTSYNYKIAAQKDTTKSWSIGITVTTPNENVYAPSNLSTGFDSVNHKINLTWTNNTSSTIRTRIERRDVTSGTNYFQIDSVSTGITSYSDYYVSMGKTYSYRVRIYTSAGNVSGYSNSSAVSVPVYPPNAPTNLILNPFSSTYFNLSWQDNSNDEDGFEIWRRDGYTGKFYLLKQIGANISSDNDQVTSGNTIYFYKVCSFRTFNGTIVRSSFTNMRNSLGGSSEYPNPTQLKDSALCPSKIKLSWHDNTSDELGFKIERKTEWGTYSQLTLLPPNTKTFIDNDGINPGIKYYYRIQSFNGSMSSDWIEFPAVVTPTSGVCP